MASFMIEFSIRMPASDKEFLELLIAEKNHVENFASSDIFQKVWLKHDKSGGYAIIKAVSEEAAWEKLHALPLHRFMQFDIQPLAA